MEKLKNNKHCPCCRFMVYQETSGGCRRYCNKEDHKVTKGAVKCENFEWN